MCMLSVFINFNFFGGRVVFFLERKRVFFDVSVGLSFSLLSFNSHLCFFMVVSNIKYI